MQPPAANEKERFPSMIEARQECTRPGFKISRGYVVVATRGPNLGKREHRLIVEAHIGRSLLATELIHHVNGNKSDNRIENLQIVSQAEHARLYRAGQTVACQACGAERYYGPSKVCRLSGNGVTYLCRECRMTARRDWHGRFQVQV